MFSASKTAGPSGYAIQRSVRLRSSASAYFNRTFTSSGTDLKRWTLSFWMKRGTLGVQSVPFSSQDTPGTGTASLYFLFSTSNTFSVFYPNTATTLSAATTAVFRDTSSWYHFVVTYDSTQATNTDRIKIYVNGVQQALSSPVYPSLNATTTWNSNCAHFISKNPVSAADYFDGYITEINSIDGQALTPTSFGAYNSTTGVWQPIRYSGTYGTNGFFVNFSDNTSTTTLGYDYSGNSNNWTANNVSLTAGVTYDSMLDVPTLTSATQANYAVMSPITGTTNLSNGNLYLTGVGAYRSGYSTISFPNTGKWYWEGVFTQANNNLGFGAASIGPNTPPNPLPNTNGIGITNGGIWYLDTSSGSSGHTGWSVATVVGMTWDSSTNTFAYTVDGTNYNTVGSVSTTDGRIWGPAAWCFATNDQLTLNFGQRPFSYTPPTGYSRLNTYNLPTPTIANGAKQFAATTYTGTGATLTVANTVNSVNFQPDFVWVKGRSGATDHALYDSVRGTTKQLESNTNTAETTESTGLTTFGSTGFTVGALAQMNTNTATYVGWQWKASNAAAVTNTSGTISSQVSANPSAGFSIVTYTGTGANATVGHGLGVAPRMMIVKNRTNGTMEWLVYHASLGAAQYLSLNTTAAAATSSSPWNNTAPTSSVFSVGGSANTNQSANNLVAYLFSEVAGYSKFGSYTGNGAANGPFVYLGFRPRYVCVKRSDGVGGWTILDSSRDTYNVAGQYLFAETSAAEGSTPLEDFLSNGFKLRATSSSVNSVGTYIYFAFAENPFNYSLAR